MGNDRFRKRVWAYIRYAILFALLLIPPQTANAGFNAKYSPALSTVAAKSRDFVVDVVERFRPGLKSIISANSDDDLLELLLRCMRTSSLDAADIGRVQHLYQNMYLNLSSHQLNPAAPITAGLVNVNMIRAASKAMEAKTELQKHTVFSTELLKLADAAPKDSVAFGALYENAHRSMFRAKKVLGGAIEVVFKDATCLPIYTSPVGSKTFTNGCSVAFEEGDKLVYHVLESGAERSLVVATGGDHGDFVGYIDSSIVSRWKFDPMGNTPVRLAQNITPANE